MTEDVDWKAIAEETGYNPKQIADLKKRWANDKPQTMGEVEKGIHWERKGRDELTDIRLSQ